MKLIKERLRRHPKLATELFQLAHLKAGDSRSYKYLYDKLRDLKKKITSKAQDAEVVSD